MMKYIPTDVFECLSINLDLTSVMQLGRTCKDTKFLAGKANEIADSLSLEKLTNITQQIIYVNTVLTDDSQRHKVCNDILNNIMSSPLKNYIIDIIYMYFYETKNETYTKEFILNTLERVHQKHVLFSTREKEVWELFQQFWLGDSYYISVFITSKKSNCELLFQTIDNDTIDVTILDPNTETTSEHFQVNNIQGILSYIWQRCGRKFFLELNEPMCQVVREYNVSKSPRSFDKLYHIYLHVQEVQQPFLKLAEDMTKKII